MDGGSRPSAGQAPRVWWLVPAALTRPFLAAVARAGGDVRDPELVLRVEVQVLFAIMAGLTALMYAYTQWVMAAPALLIALFLALAVGNGLLLVLLQRHGRLRPVAHCTEALAFVSMCAATYWTGGLRLSNASPFFITLVAAIFLLGWEGLPWAFGSVVAPVVFQVAGWAGVSFPDYVPPEGRDTDAFMTWFTAIVVVALFVAYYEAARIASVRRRAEAEAARSQFLANVSHELRTPLHAIMGMTRQALGAELHAEVRAALQTVEHSADDLRGLIDDLLLLASMEQDRFVLRPHDFDPVEEVERVANVLRFRCQQQGLELALTISPDTPRWVHGDGARLRQVISNLGSNAVKYTERGSVEVAVGPRPELGSSAIELSVADSGLGIRAEDRERIFAPFTQAHHDKSRPARGVGLGLHIVRQIVRAMHGDIEVDSTVGKGSTFRARIPFEEAHAAQSPAPSPVALASADGASLRVLVADDDVVNVRMATLMLEELGCQVSVARDGLQAVERWAAEGPDAILMDIQMPELDGEQAMARIRAEERANGRPPVPIIALTGYGTPEHRERYLAAGASSCLFKPFRFEELKRVIASASGGDARPANSA